MVLNVKKLCTPSQLVLVITLASFAMQVMSTKGFFSQHNILVILSLLLGDLTLSVLLDVFCKTGHEQFAWALVSVSLLIMFGAERLLQKPFKRSTPVNGSGVPRYGPAAYSQPRPMEAMTRRSKMDPMAQKRQPMAPKKQPMAAPKREGMQGPSPSGMSGGLAMAPVA
jgi:hypothetical protein